MLITTNMHHLLPLLMILLLISYLTSNNSSTTLFTTNAFSTSSSSSSFSRSSSSSSSSRITATSTFDTDTTTATTTELQSKNNLLHSIPRIKASEFDPNRHYFRRNSSSSSNKDEYEYEYYETPVIIENVLSLNECEEYTDELINEYGHIDITLQRKQKRTTGSSSSAETEKEEEEEETETDMYYCTFLEAIKLIVSNQEKHNHNDSLLAFCEGLLSSSTTPSSSSTASSKLSLQKHFENIREQLFQQRRKRKDQDTQDTTTDSRQEEEEEVDNTIVNHVDIVDPCWFLNYFPKIARPSDCIILSGVGSSSTLHRDPLEWTGTNLCLDGYKTWRFIVPSNIVDASLHALENEQENENDDDDDDDGFINRSNSNNNSGVDQIDELLNSYRLDSIAWDDDDNDDDDDNKDDGSSPSTLSAGWQSDYSLYDSYNNENDEDDEEDDDEDDDDDDDDQKEYERTTAIAADISILKPNIPVDIATITTSTEDKDAGQVTIWSGVQKPGDMIIIPAYWYHQTYNIYKPSLAIASQRCGSERDIMRVMRHILNHYHNYHAKEVDANDDDGIVDIEDILSSLISSSSLSKPSPKKLIDQLFHYISEDNN